MENVFYKKLWKFWIQLKFKDKSKFNLYSIQFGQKKGETKKNKENSIHLMNFNLTVLFVSKLKNQKRRAG